MSTTVGSPHIGRTLLRAIRIWAASFAILTQAFDAPAHTFVEQQFRCPIDGHAFSQYVSASGTQFGCRLDGKPLGPIAAPWDLVQCPKCKCILTEKAYDQPTLAKLKVLVVSPAYRDAAARGPSYYCLALIRQRLGFESLLIGDAYLKASWQVERDRGRCDEFLKQALKHYSAGLSALDQKSRHWASVVRLCGELERRLGRFQAAAVRLQNLRTAPSSQPDLPLIDRQLSLVARRDSAPHAATVSLESLVTGRKASR